MGVGLALIAGVAAFIKEATERAPHAPLLALYGVGSVAGIAAGVLNLFRSHYRDVREDWRQSPDDLRGCLYVLSRVMCGYKRVTTPQDGWMRLTVHRVDRGELEQVVDYVGSGDGGAGRRFAPDAGLIGTVMTDPSKRPHVFSRPANMDWERWVDYLVRAMRMPRSRAVATRSDRFAFMAVPIRGKRGGVSAVVYADAPDPDFFDAGTQAVFLQGCIGLAQWANERYG